jgi:hypothetical protein
LISDWTFGEREMQLDKKQELGWKRIGIGVGETERESQQKLLITSSSSQTVFMKK